MCETGQYIAVDEPARPGKKKAAHAGENIFIYVAGMSLIQFTGEQIAGFVKLLCKICRKLRANLHGAAEWNLAIRQCQHTDLV